MRFEKTLASTRKIQKRRSGSYWVLWFNIRGSVCQLRRLDSFGPERVITKAEANILYEIDGQPALDL
jgi:hypothetical protein